ncbi:EpsG family protein [Tetragenococcus koreensis]|uniref:EpsG family protein n=1 Tax=Tetragenococcus koreensis TaxID=290335 RepID=UPI000F4E646B|nr:EpsG family protein [Tetragenococcus koreensis]AYW46466.1 hypothetical protein C7K43_11355 [Tetragenococcus koreensis]GEN91999.1 hypothetical protein TKO01_20450 [Tetragenococcus koreensis]
MFYYYFFIGLLILNLITDKSPFQSNFYAKLLLVYMIALTLIVGITNTLTADMRIYLKYLNIMGNVSLSDSMSLTRWEPGFVIFQWLLSKISTSYMFFIPVSALLILLLIIKPLKETIPFNKIPLVMFGYLSLFSFYNLLNNILRQGFSVAFLLVMLVYLEKNRYLHAIIFLIIATAFHKTAIIGIIIIILYKMSILLSKYVYIYFLASLTMVFNINQKLVTILPFSLINDTESYLQQYTSDSSLLKYGSVNRLDFLLFSVFWFLLGLFFYKKYLSNDSFYLLVIKAYAIYGTVFFLLGFISFSDRLAIYSWFLIPIVLFYPIIKMESKFKLFWSLFGIVVCMAMMHIFDVSDHFSVLIQF